MPLGVNLKSREANSQTGHRMTIKRDTIWFKDTSNGSLKPRNEKIIESRELKRIQQAFLITYRSLMNQESIERWSYPSCSVSSLEFFLLIPQLVISSRELRK